MSFRLKLLPLSIFFSAMCAFSGCKSVTGVFSENELLVIRAGGTGIMRLYTVDNPADSVLLRSQSAAVQEEILSSPGFSLLVNRMLATGNDPDNEGVGIAAPQGGILRRIIAVQRFDKEGEPFEVYVNPEIVFYSGNKISGIEGCLSVPGLRGRVARAAEITLRYRDSKTLKERE